MKEGNPSKEVLFRGGRPSLGRGGVQSLVKLKFLEYPGWVVWNWLFGIKRKVFKYLLFQNKCLIFPLQCVLESLNPVFWVLLVARTRRVKLKKKNEYGSYSPKKNAMYFFCRGGRLVIKMNRIWS